MRTIATCFRPEEAHLIRLRLGAIGIPAYLRDETMAQLQPFYSNLLGGVRLEVADEDYDATIAFLESDSGSDAPMEDEESTD